MCGIVGAIRANHNVVDFLTDGLKRLEYRLEIDEFSRARIDASAAELVEERTTVKGMGLI